MIGAVMDVPPRPGRRTPNGGSWRPARPGTGKFTALEGDHAAPEPFRLPSGKIDKTPEAPPRRPGSDEQPVLYSRRGERRELVTADVKRALLFAFALCAITAVLAFFVTQF
jgi:hypothetical protein